MTKERRMRMFRAEESIQTGEGEGEGDGEERRRRKAEIPVNMVLRARGYMHPDKTDGPGTLT